MWHGSPSFRSGQITNLRVFRFVNRSEDHHQMWDLSRLSNRGGSRGKVIPRQSESSQTPSLQNGEARRCLGGVRYKLPVQAALLSPRPTSGPKETGEQPVLRFDRACAGPFCCRRRFTPRCPLGQPDHLGSRKSNGPRGPSASLRRYPYTLS
jgi:hypothetical protein